MTDKSYDPYARVLGPPAQTPEPVEPSDESEAAFRAWWGDPHQHITPLDGFHAGYRAGLAAEAAAHAETRAMLDKSRAYADSEHARAERFKRDYQAQQIKAEAKDWGDHFAPKIAAIEGRAQQRAAEPTPEVAWNYSAPPDSEKGQFHSLFLDDGDLSAPIRYDGMVPQIFGHGKPALPTWGGMRMGGYGSVKAWRPASAAPADRPIPTCIHADVDHEGPCRYQAAAPAKGETNDRLARLERDSHAPVDFTDIFDALTRRVDDVEIQARVMRRWVTGDYQQRPGEMGVDLLARIEREERSEPSVGQSATNQPPTER